MNDAPALLRARGELVARYRKAVGSFPDGVDTKWDRWYRAEDWRDDGVFIGDPDWFSENHPDPDLPDGGAGEGGAVVKMRGRKK